MADITIQRTDYLKETFVKIDFAIDALSEVINSGQDLTNHLATLQTIHSTLVSETLKVDEFIYPDSPENQLPS